MKAASLLFFAVTSLLAQGEIFLTGRGDHQFFDGGKLVSHPWDQKRQLEWVELAPPAGKKAKTGVLPIPDEHRFLWVQDGVTTLRGPEKWTKEDSGRNRLESGCGIFTFEKGALKEVATYPFEGRLYYCVPLQDGRFFLMTDFGPFHYKGLGSLAAIAKPNSKGVLEVEDLVDFGLKDYLVDRKQKPFLPLDGGLMQMVLESDPQKAGDTFVLTAGESGLLFVFSLKDGRHLRTAKVFPSLEEKRLEVPQFQQERVILGVQPRPNGHLLLATRTEDASRYSHAIFEPKPDTLSGTKTPPKEAAKIYETYAKDNAKIRFKALEAFPEIQYWDFNPVTGDFYLENTPKGLPAKIRDGAHYRKFRFRMRPDGAPEAH